MASCDSDSLEYWVDDSVYNVTSEVREKIVELLEPFRAEIEQQIENYEPDEHSWRTYRNAMWYSIPDDIEHLVDIIIEQGKI